jgi:translation initiation factor 1
MNKPKDPFAVLEKLRDSLPAGNPSGPAHANNTRPDSAVDKRGPSRAVVRMERKGRRGKEATVIEKLDLTVAELEQWCKELKQALGCGGTVEDGTIVLQGDLRQRVAPLLTARHVGKVTIG